MGYSPQGRKELAMTERLHFHFISAESSEIFLYISREGNQDPAPRLHFCLLTAPPSSLHPLSSLISNCVNL